MLLVVMLFSPLIALIIAVLTVAAAKSARLPKAGVKDLLWLTLLFAIIGAVATLLMTIAWMFWYEQTTGIDAGNAPLGWIFFFGPAGAAFGQLCALVLWWFRKPRGRAREGEALGR